MASVAVGMVVGNGSEQEPLGHLSLRSRQKGGSSLHIRPFASLNEGCERKQGPWPLQDLPSEAVNILSSPSLLLKTVAFNTFLHPLLDLKECWNHSVPGARFRFCLCPESPPKTLIAFKLR